MPAIFYPSWAYNATQAPVIVASAAAFAALPGTGWAYTPFASTSGPNAPYDPGLIDTDTRLQQLLIESRIQTMMLAQAFSITDDPQTMLRPDVLANDSGLLT